MATDFRYIRACPTNLAEFNEWGAAISTQIGACLPRATGSGQINWTTNTVYASGDVGYEVYRFDDSLQATNPVYVRVDYGKYDSPTAARLVFTIGNKIDSFGNVNKLPGSGIVSARSLRGKNVGNYFFFPSCCSAGSGYFHFANSLYSPDITIPIFCFLDRTRDENGNITSDGMLLYAGSGGNTSYAQQFLPDVGTETNFATNNTVLIFDNPSFGYEMAVHGRHVLMGTPQAFWGRSFFGTMLAYHPSHGPGEMVPFTVDCMGTDHTYLPLGAALLNNNNALGDQATMAMRWE